ncbi:alpha-L-rhamnosidase N-terminal domain-containing protein, partial [Kribbella sp.]|uniref:alpha-L-rhamnosidase N-terminal domain-containing protein n=1 Tax=Kribbella sp. TaxID=1871183 RepID=UPI002D72BA52
MWTGQWIWSAGTALGGPTRSQPYGSLDRARFDQRVLFRRVFEVADVPGDAWLRISADARYLLYVNGSEVGAGPVRHGPRRLEYDVYDVRALLVPGRNVVAVLGRFYGHPVPWWEPSPPSFTMGGGGLVAELRTGDRVIGTDETWRCSPGIAWQAAEPPSMLLTQLPEFLDARLLDPRWTQPDFDDSGWEDARVLAEHSIVGPQGATHPPTEPWGALAPRPIPHLTGDLRTATTIHHHIPHEPVAGGNGRGDVWRELSAVLGRRVGAGDRVSGGDGDRVLVVADFGMVVAGRLELEVDGPAGAVVVGALLEVPTVAALDSAPVFRYVTRGHDDRYISGDPIGGRYAVLLLDHPTVVRSVRLRESHRPRRAVQPFTSSDERLDEIYRVGLRTVDLTAHDAYVDCPTREQRAWTGDAVVHQSVDLVANQDWSLARWN